MSSSGQVPPPGAGGFLAEWLPARGLFFLTLWIILFEGPTGEPTLIGRIYRGYSITPLGSLVGFGWAFFDGLIGGAIFAWLYNLLAGRIRGNPARA
jgi:hypothetical protein